MRDDTISRREAIKAFEELPDCPNGYSDTYDKARIIGVLEELPPAERRGRWIVIDEKKAKCSRCGNVVHPNVITINVSGDHWLWRTCKSYRLSATGICFSIRWKK